MTSGRLVFLAGAVIFGVSAPLRAQSVPRTIWDGVYTADQARRGEEIYFHECARCHGQFFDGGDEVPPLAGGQFMADWEGQSVADLVRRIRLTMPMENPGHLDLAATADVAAYLLQANQIPGGNVELPSDPLRQNQIRIKELRADTK